MKWANWIYPEFEFFTNFCHELNICHELDRIFVEFYIKKIQSWKDATQ